MSESLLNKADNGGCGFLEFVYQEALAVELLRRGIPFQREADLPILYEGQKPDTVYRADFIVFDEVVLQLKAVSNLTGVPEAQIINYLKASRLSTGLLLNFAAQSLEFKRFVHTPLPLSAESAVRDPS